LPVDAPFETAVKEQLPDAVQNGMGEPPELAFERRRQAVARPHHHRAASPSWRRIAPVSPGKVTCRPSDAVAASAVGRTLSLAASPALTRTRELTARAGAA